MAWLLIHLFLPFLNASCSLNPLQPPATIWFIKVLGRRRHKSSLSGKPYGSDSTNIRHSEEFFFKELCPWKLLFSGMLIDLVKVSEEELHWETRLWGTTQQFQSDFFAYLFHELWAKAFHLATLRSQGFQMTGEQSSWKLIMIHCFVSASMKSQAAFQGPD